MTLGGSCFQQSYQCCFLLCRFPDIQVRWKNPKKYIKNQRSGRFRRTKGGHRAARGQPGGCLARPSPWPRHLPSWLGPTPPVPYFGPIYSPGAKPPEHTSLFQSTSWSHRNPLFFSGELIWRLNWPPVRGKSSPSSSPSPLHHPSMAPPFMCE